MVTREPQFEIGSFHTIGRTKYIVESVNVSKATLRALKTGKVKVVELGVKEKKGESNTLLALDVSTSSTGWAIFENGKLIHCGTIKLSNKDTVKRISSMTNRIDCLIKTHNIKQVAIEDVYFKNGFIDAHAILNVIKGAIMYMLSLNGLKAEYIAPVTWKRHFGIIGKDYDENKKLAISKCKELTGKKYQEDCAEATLLGLDKLRK